MPDTLLQKLLNNEINFDYFKKWLLTEENENNFKCSQNEFLTYFLNFIHEEVNSQKKFREHSTKCTPRKIKPSPSEINLAKKGTDLSKKVTATSSPSVRSLEKSFSDMSVEMNTSTPKVSRLQTNADLTNTSTPKVCKLQPDLNSSYFSPVSPLYKEQSFTTPKHKKHSVCLGDFLIKKTTNKKKQSLQEVAEDSGRRITPTTINHMKNNESFKSVNSFNNFNTKEIVADDLNDDRLFLAKERLKIVSRKDLDDNILALRSKKLSISDGQEQLEPQPHLVTCQKEITVLSNIYILILKNNLVLNISGEIYFLISLLLIKHYVIDNKDDSQMGVDFLSAEDKAHINIQSRITGYSDYFESIHNVVYFSVKCLEAMFDILKYYDKSTLKVFSVNKRIKDYSPKFSEKLWKASEKKSERIVEIVDEKTNVSYNLDTDTKDNFSSEASFLSFRKQRDLFYEILRIWEKSHLDPAWSFQIGLSGKIKTLLSLQSETANFMHFARLFKAQILSSCGKSSMAEDDHDTFPINFPNVDPSKLNRLRNRIVTKQSSNGVNVLPHFTGYEDFYKEFILSASNNSFNIHICDTFISEIIELNENSFNCGGLSEAGTDVDASMRKSYAINLRLLRVLAKFLGFVESLPYKSDVNNRSENILNHHIKIRGKKMPSLDIKELLLKSIKRNIIVLTIPWLVVYLSMLDYITLQLPYYISVYEILFQIYHSYERNTKNMDYNTALVKFCLGWLFDLPHFPNTQYLTFCTKRNAHFIRKSHTMDDLPIVDQNVLYSCCPYLEEIRKVLTSSCELRSVTVKHITPVTAVESSEQISKKRLEQQLEDAFFNGQPESVRKTVEFVSERLASACVKYICTSIVPPFKKDAIKEIKTVLELQKAEMQVLSPVRERNQKIIIRMKVSQLAQEKLSALRIMCATELYGVLSDRIPKSIDSLLAIDTLLQTKTTCISIASRICRDRINQWINSHLTVNIFMKDVEKEIQKIFNSENRKAVEDKLPFALPSGGRREYHNDDTWSGFHMTEKLRNLAVEIVEKSENVNKGKLTNILLEISKSLNERNDLNDIIISTACSLLVDVAILLIALRPDVMPDEDLLHYFLQIWQSSSSNNLFKDVLSPKNVALLEDASNRKQVWSNFATFLACLVKEKVISCDSFESQCTAFFRKDWNKSILENVCYFMKQFVECYKQNGGADGKFTLLLEFLSDFCKEM